MKQIVFWTSPLLSILVASIAFAGGDHGGHGGHEVVASGLFNYSTIIAPLGITTLLGLLTTLTLGLNMHKNRKLLFPWHKRIAFTTVFLAITHASLVLIFH
jgi:hypothetical protein